MKISDSNLRLVIKEVLRESLALSDSDKDLIEDVFNSISTKLDLPNLKKRDWPLDAELENMAYGELISIGLNSKNYIKFYAVLDAITEKLESSHVTSEGFVSINNGNTYPLRKRSLKINRTNKTALSEGMVYHLSTGTPIDDNVYRPGTPEFFALFREARALYNQGLYNANSSEKEWLDSDIGDWGFYNDEQVPLDFPMWVDGPVSEAKYKGREVTLGVKGAKRSGGRAYVYVRDPKSGKVKKIFFGSGMPDAMGDSEAHRKRRKSFGDRHDCANKKDKLKPGYWACRATKMFGRNIPGWW